MNNALNNIGYSVKEIATGLQLPFTSNKVESFTERLWKFSSEFISEYIVFIAGWVRIR